jgi:hypothetical protein
LPPPCFLSASLFIIIFRLGSFFSIGIRFLFLFSSFTGRVSFETGNSIFPKILGPVSFSTSIFSTTACCCSSVTGSSVTGVSIFGSSIFSTSVTSSFVFFAFALAGFSVSVFEFLLF